MFHIYCPHCCEHREEEEFHVKGQAHIARPVWILKHFQTRSGGITSTSARTLVVCIMNSGFITQVAASSST